MFIDFTEISIFLFRCFSRWNSKAKKHFAKFVVDEIHLYFIDYIGLYVNIASYLMPFTAVESSQVLDKTDFCAIFV